MAGSDCQCGVDVESAQTQTHSGFLCVGSRLLSPEQDSVGNVDPVELDPLNKVLSR